MPSYMTLGQDVQHDPYRYLMTESEKQYARNLPFRFLFNGLAAGGVSVYFLSRHQQMGRIKAMSISFDIVFGVAWRVLLATAVADQVSRRMFVNYRGLRQSQMAENEVRKVMRTWPQAKPHVAPHKRPNSYVWV